MVHTFKNIILSLLVISSVYIALSSVPTLKIGDYAIAEVQHQRNDENKILLSVTSNGEGFLLPVFVKDIEKEFFQFEQGEKIIFKVYSTADRKPEYLYLSRYSLPFMGALLMSFICLLIGFFGWKVLFPFISLSLSIAFTTLILFPGLLEGANTLLFGFVGITAILFISILVSNGFSRSAFVAAVCSVITLCLAYLIGDLSISALHLFGHAGSNITYLAPNFPNIDIQGIFLIGMYLGVVGIIDDVAMAQSSAVQEIHEANSHYSISQLYNAGMNIGKAHVFSMINTLVFAYVGMSIPSYFYIMTLDYPVWVIISSTLFTEEFLRMIMGSISLLLAIPFTTIVMAWVVKRKTENS